MMTAISPDAPMLDHALDYARRGVPVFPCRPDKTPYTFNGVKDASTSAIKIRQWWGPGQAPQAMIGLAMGKASGMWALDPDAPKEPGGVDGRAEWRRLVAENGGCPNTQTNNTPGGGQHLLFKYREDRPMTNKKGDLRGLGIDVRGEGGYIIAPPSVNADGRAYEVAEPMQPIADAPEWLYDLISPKADAAAPALELEDSPSLAPAGDPPSIREQAFAKVNAVQSRDATRDERKYAETALNLECENRAWSWPKPLRWLPGATCSASSRVSVAGFGVGTAKTRPTKLIAALRLFAFSTTLRARIWMGGCSQTAGAIRK
jgi:hypothetical protein